MSAVSFVSQEVVTVPRTLTPEQHATASANLEARQAKAKDMLRRKVEASVICANTRLPLREVLRLGMEVREEQRAGVTAPVRPRRGRKAA